MGLLEIGRIVGCHGLAGRIKVLSYLDSQDMLNDLPEVFIGRRSQETIPFRGTVQTGREFFIPGSSSGSRIGRQPSLFDPPSGYLPKK
jgi:ribosomal 30S subunit maturation factor RimM